MTSQWLFVRNVHSFEGRNPRPTPVFFYSVVKYPTPSKAAEDCTHSKTLREIQKRGETRDSVMECGSPYRFVRQPPAPLVKKLTDAQNSRPQPTTHPFTFLTNPTTASTSFLCNGSAGSE